MKKFIVLIIVLTAFAFTQSKIYSKETVYVLRGNCGIQKAQATLDSVAKMLLVRGYEIGKYQDDLLIAEKKQETGFLNPNYYIKWTVIITKSGEINARCFQDIPSISTKLYLRDNAEKKLLDYWEIRNAFDSTCNYEWFFADLN